MSDSFIMGGIALILSEIHTIKGITRWATAWSAVSVLCGIAGLVTLVAGHLQ